MAESKIIIEFSEYDRALLKRLIAARPYIITRPSTYPAIGPYVGDVPTYPQWWQNPVISSSEVPVSWVGAKIVTD